ncbi:MAG: hypothetical protein V3R68_07850 [Gammaproteobacteria bacterium]
MNQGGQSKSTTPELAARTKRLAVILGLLAAGMYIGFILFYS